MVAGFAKIIIGVPHLDVALGEYEALLGPFERRGVDAWRSLFNVGIELKQDSELEHASIAGLELWTDGADTWLPEDVRSLPLALNRRRAVSAEASASGIRGVDHIVLRTGDADDCIRLFNRDLGMRLALDQAVPEWGGRMLFFRCGKLTLEVIQGEELPPTDAFWGITYLCEDLTATLAHLDKAGVIHSGARLGRKPGTRVATVKSHCLGLPTLLIEQAPG